MNKFYQFLTNLIKNKGYIIVIIIITLTAFLGYNIKNVGVQADILSILPPDDPVVQNFRKIGDKFGGNTIGLVIIESDSIFSHSVLSGISKMEESYREIEGVGFTQSLISMIDIRKTREGIEVSRLIGDEIPDNRRVLDSLKSYILSREMYRRVIISEDGQYTAIVVRIMEGYDRNEIGLKIRVVTEELKKDLNVEVYYSGIPLLMTFINEIILKDLKRLMPVTVVLVILVLWAGFRRPLGVILPVISVLVASAWTVGSMGIAGKDFSLVSNLMPVILIAVGSAYGIHVINRFYEVGEVDSTISHISLPVMLAAFTTMAGFLSFLSSALVPIKEFGIFSSIGVLVALVLALTLIPFVLYFTHRKKTTEAITAFTPGRWIRPLSRITIVFKKYFIIIAIVLFVLTIVFSPTIKRSANILEYFKPGSKVRESLDISSSKFGGSRPVTLDIKGDLSNPENLITMDYIGNYISTFDHTQDPQSIVNLLKETNYNMSGFYNIPNDEGKINNLYFFLLGQDVLELYINEDETEGLMQVPVATEDMGDIREIVAKVEVLLDTLSPQKEWYMRMLRWELDKAGLSYKTPIEIRIPEVPSEVLMEELRTYLKGNEVSVVIPERNIGKVIDAALNEDYEKIEDIGGEEGEYLVRDVKTIIEDVSVKYKVNRIYEDLVGKNIADYLEKGIKGILYWYVVNDTPIVSAENMEIVHTGFPRIHMRLDRKLFLSQYQSMGMAILLVFIMLLLLLRSPQGSLFSLIPIIFTVTLNFGIMELLRIPIDEATVMIAALAIGIGIDYVIHFTSRLKEELKEKDDLEEAMKATIETTGVAILINAVSVAVGFFALFWAELIPLQRFGILVTGTMLVSSISSITLLPALLLRFRPGYIMDIKNNEGGNV